MRTCDVPIVLYRVRFVQIVALARTLKVSCVPWSYCVYNEGFVDVKVLFVREGFVCGCRLYMPPARKLG